MIGGRYNSALKFLAIVTAHWGKLTVLEYLQQFYLNRDGHLANLIQKNGPVRAAPAEYPAMGFNGASEGAFFVTKQFRFNELLWKLGKICGNEGFGKTLPEALLFFIKRYESRPAYCRGSKTFTGSGLTEQ